MVFTILPNVQPHFFLTCDENEYQNSNQIYRILFTLATGTEANSSHFMVQKFWQRIGQD